MWKHETNNSSKMATLQKVRGIVALMNERKIFDKFLNKVIISLYTSICLNIYLCVGLSYSTLYNLSNVFTTGNKMNSLDEIKSSKGDNWQRR